MSDDGSDRGWNIAWGKARYAWLAKLLGKPRNGKSSIYTDFILGGVAMAIVLKVMGVW